MNPLQRFLVMLFLTNLLQSDLKDKTYFQVKNATREISLTDGTYFKESSKLQIQIINDKAPLVYYYAIPFHFWQQVSSHGAKNIRTGQQLPTKIVRIDDYHVDLFYIEITLDALPPSGEKMQLVVEYSVAQGSKYINKYSSLLSNHSAIDGQDLNEKLKSDRKLQCIFAAQIPSLYDISIQKTTIKLPTGSYVEHNTTMSPVQYKTDKIEIGPNEYLSTLEYDNITVKYSAQSITLDVKSKRSIFLSGLPIRVGDFENQLGRVHVIDQLDFTNTDPQPEGLRQSRLHLHYLRQQENRMVQNITLILPKASNIKIYDRVGKVASRKIKQEDNQTVLTIHPRHELMGGHRGQITVEYDINIAEYQDKYYGVILPSTAKINSTAFYSNVEVCVYPPYGAANVNLISGFDFEYKNESTTMKSLDVEERVGTCYGRSLSSDNVAQKQFGVKFTIQIEKVQQRLIHVSSVIFAFVAGAYLIRVLC